MINFLDRQRFMGYVEQYFKGKFSLVNVDFNLCNVEYFMNSLAYFVEVTVPKENLDNSIINISNTESYYGDFLGKSIICLVGLKTVDTNFLLKYIVLEKEKFWISDSRENKKYYSLYFDFSKWLLSLGIDYYITFDKDAFYLYLDKDLTFEDIDKLYIGRDLEVVKVKDFEDLKGFSCVYKLYKDIENVE